MPDSAVVKPPGQAKPKAHANGHKKPQGWKELDAMFG